LGVEPSEYANEKIEILTGQTASTGTNANDWCGNPPTVGDLKVCQQVSVFGSYFVKTELNAVPDIGRLRDRSDVPREIVNQAANTNPFVPSEIARFQQDTRSQLGLEIYKLAIGLERDLEYALVQGNTTKTGTNRRFGFISEFDGLDRLIKTGYVDAVAGTACPAADSAIVTFGANVGGTIGGGDGRNIVQVINDMYWGLSTTADKVGMGGTQWVWLMRQEAFRALVDAYACSYATYRCSTTNAGQPFVTEATYTNQLRMEMMNGRYLLIDNVPVPVVFSEGVPQTTLSANNFESDIYLVPITWSGRRLLTLEYFPMDNQYAREYSSFVDAETVSYSNDGLYIFGRRDNGFCKEYLMGASMRMILRAPFLAGRIDNIQYQFAGTGFRNADPAASFYANGGVTFRS
jgi:hypothetical protein